MRNAFVLVNTELGSELELQSELKSVEGIIGVYGIYDVVVEIGAESDQKLNDIIFSRVRTLKRARSTLTLTIVL